ncbi:MULTISPECIES: DUF3558 domain-containing protein [Streptomyces]|uniref:DUF3558 domain-containing protein n=1 Tax=Streptomyces thermoviolaceus subsp. thermoviolaceus TaxID=66860 RepID=A0ABX0YUX2_STRTL|nr:MULTISPECIES: DUF3558 domain-containing protein [Streptomyces]NJP15704.1 DUF3558 domain-containing protein [Streptomyces thermoviolaceus subsp. thermoviolaceus]RSS02520.1 DUF3558 domain-containing protein [Streptomyces sp. WAC00469]WTD46726.1 DUF3558 domain-containing protein [Streptomyces thermoviolaceus]
MRDLPLPLALTARLSPVLVIACAGWALTSGPFAAPSTEHHAAGQQAGHTGTKSSSGSAPSSSSSAPSKTAPAMTYTSAPAPCTAIPEKTITSLVPKAKTAGKEIPSTDSELRRTCSWNALDGYDYRWLDVSFEIMRSEQAARTSYQQRTEEKDGGGAVPGLGDAAYSHVGLSTEDKQQSREGMVLVRVANALVVVNYSGSDFDSGKAPATDEINKGAIQAARAAVTTLEGSRPS